MEGDLLVGRRQKAREIFWGRRKISGLKRRRARRVLVKNGE